MENKMSNKASTVPQAFDLFLQKLEPKKTSKDAIKKRHIFIRDTFSKKIFNDGRKTSILSGSYARNTQIEPINDVDIIIFFSKEEYWENFESNPIELLLFTQKLIQQTFPDQDKQIQSHSIGIKFQSIPDVDIIPAFIQDNDNEIFIIPDKDLGCYIETSPPTHKKFISNHNELIGKKFIPLVKMMKCWRNKLKREGLNKYGMELKIKSFHLEVFLMNIIQSNFTGYSQCLYSVFSEAGEAINNSCNDPADLSGDLGNYLSFSQKETLTSIFIQTSNKIKKLLEYQAMGDHEKAIEGWHEIFGDPFPLPIRSNKPLYTKKQKTEYPEHGRNFTYG